MSTIEARAGQALLFSEPSIAETGVWCVLNEEVDPAEWAGLCRKMGRLSARTLSSTMRQFHLEIKL